jgi:hypothetical protein
MISAKLSTFRQFGCLSLAMMAAAAIAGAQQPQVVHGITINPAASTPTPTPFPLDAETGQRKSLEFLKPEQMSAADTQLTAANVDEIIRRAGLQGFRVERTWHDGGWQYEQAVCPVMPNYLVLEFSLNAGPGDLSQFSVVVPRGEGHLRVIPVRRRGNSLWTPAASNSLTLHDFNVLVKQSGLSPDWLTTGLCYAALAGGHVRTSLVAKAPEEEAFPLYAPATLRVSRNGGAGVEIVDQTHPEHGKLWSLSFAQDGSLLKVRHSAAVGLSPNPVNGPAEVSGHPTLESPMEITPASDSASKE